MAKAATGLVSFGAIASFVVHIHQSLIGGGSLNVPPPIVLICGHISGPDHPTGSLILLGHAMCP
jgi:hypothetical protein